MHAEDFVLILKKMFVLKQPTRTETLYNPIYQQKATQLSLLQRNNPTEIESKESTEQETFKTNIVIKSKRRRTSRVDLKVNWMKELKVCSLSLVMMAKLS